MMEELERSINEILQWIIREERILPLIRSAILGGIVGVGLTGRGLRVSTGTGGVGSFGRGASG